MNYVFGKQREQILIESIEEYVQDDNEVRVMDKLVDSPDLYSLGFLTAKNGETGRPKYSPQDMLKLYIYGYYNGIRSSRKLQKQIIINREVIWLLKGLQPKQRAISDFRKFRMVIGEVSIAIFAYNLKRVISIMGFKGLMERIIEKMKLKVA
ncbi:transposase [Clostridium frigoris]|uniref:Transposase n=1 Tax=Clostridium frigoris TaxID=205327 RepID=A0ABS6BXV8_9CLOT|nr:transposase [Clostridium frigoris]MBU3161421.1 transposase [Clostridium frigoris]